MDSINYMMGRRLSALENMENQGIDINSIWEAEDEEIERRVEAFEQKYSDVLEDDEDYDEDDEEFDDEEEGIQQLPLRSKITGAAGEKTVPVPVPVAEVGGQ